MGYSLVFAEGRNDDFGPVWIGSMAEGTSKLTVSLESSDADLAQWAAALPGVLQVGGSWGPGKCSPRVSTLMAVVGAVVSYAQS